MKQLDERVKSLLESEAMWYVGTMGDDPNVSCIGFKEILDDGKLLLCDVFMNHTLKNIRANGKVAITVCSPEKMEAYQISGTAEYLTESPKLESWKELAAAMSGGKLQPKGVVIVTPEAVRVMSASRENGKEL